MIPGGCAVQQCEVGVTGEIHVPVVHLALSLPSPKILDLTSTLPMTTLCSTDLLLMSMHNFFSFFFLLFYISSLCVSFPQAN